MPHPAQPQHTNYGAPRTRKRHQQEHRPRPTERSDPTQHAKGRTGACPGPRKGATTRRNVTRGGGFVALEFRLGNFAFQTYHEISHVKFRVHREFPAHQQYTLWTVAGGADSDSRGLREISHGEIYHRKFDLARNPPPLPMSSRKPCFTLKMPDCCLNLQFVPRGRSSPGGGGCSGGPGKANLLLGAVPALCRNAPPCPLTGGGA